jgi:hypothetical protein
MFGNYKYNESAAQDAPRVRFNVAQSGIQSINKFVMKIFKNLLKLAKLSAIRPVFTSNTFYSAAISLVLMAPLQRRGWR